VVIPEWWRKLANLLVKRTTNSTTPVARSAPWFVRLPRDAEDRENSCQADFFCGKPNGITFPYSSSGIHFVAFFLKLLGTKNSMIFAINHLPCKNKTEAKKFSF
jgi:hypothetical protein